MHTINFIYWQSPPRSVFATLIRLMRICRAHASKRVLSCNYFTQCRTHHRLVRLRGCFRNGTWLSLGARTASFFSSTTSKILSKIAATIFLTITSIALRCLMFLIVVVEAASVCRLVDIHLQAFLLQSVLKNGLQASHRTGCGALVAA